MSDHNRAWLDDMVAFYGASSKDGCAAACVRDELDELRAACAEFVRKVDAGEARSVRSYQQMKDALLYSAPK